MEKNGIKASSMVLAGALLTAFNSIGKGWASEVLVLIGFVIFLLGLKNIKEMLDEQGKNAIQLVYIAAIIGAISALIGLIPIVGIIATIGLIVAFVFQLIGYSKLKSSNTIGEIGSKGANLLLISMIIALVGGIFRIIPAIGGVIGTIFSLVVLIMVITGWRNIQKGILGENKVAITSISLILVGMLLQLGNEASRGWGAAVAGLIGLILLIIGLKQFRSTLDEVGQKAVQLISVAVYIGLAATVLDFVASLVSMGSGLKGLASGDLSGIGKAGTFEMIVSLIFIATFIIELLGFLKLKKSNTFNEAGKSGINLLVIALVIAAAASLFSGVLPIGGNIISSILGIAGLFLILFGWLRVQASIE